MNSYKRIALFCPGQDGQITSDAPLVANLQWIKRAYGNNCKVYVFTRNVSHTSLYCAMDGLTVLPVTYLHDYSSHSNTDHLLKLSEDGPSENGYDEIDHQDFKELEHVFEDIDLMQIAGIGRMNAEHMAECMAATGIAEMHHVPYILTGVESDNPDGMIGACMRKLFKNSALVDVQDADSLEYAKKYNDNVTCSIDDAFGLCASGLPMLEETKGKYINIIIDAGLSGSREETVHVDKLVKDFAKHEEDDERISRINLICFNQDDYTKWTGDRDLSVNGKICVCDLSSYEVTYLKQVVENAILNVSTSRVSSVLSMASGIPCYSLGSTVFEQNDLEIIYRQFGSAMFKDVNKASADDLCDVISNHLGEQRSLLDQNHNDVFEAFCKKARAIANFYETPALQSGLIENIVNPQVYQSLPCITVIVPVYNNEKYIRKCIGSILSQSLHNIEVICIDDGSIDNSLGVLDELAYRDKRINVISQKNHGVAYSRNVAISRARGEYLAFMDSDDYYPDNKVLEDLYYAARSNHVNICGGGFQAFDEMTGKLSADWADFSSKYLFPEDGMYEYRKYQFDYGWVRFIYRREFLRANHLEMPIRCFFEDPVFFVRAMDAAGEFYGLKRISYTYRFNHKETQLSSRKVIDLLRGLNDNCSFAVEKGYQTLLYIECARLKNDFATSIGRYLIDDETGEVTSLVSQLSDTLKAYEPELFRSLFVSIIRKKDCEIGELNRQIDQLHWEVNDIYHGETWKLGNFLLFIPKKIKRAMGK